MPINASIRGSFGAQGKFGAEKILPYTAGYLSTTTFTVPGTGLYDVYVVGGGAAGGSSYGSGGGSGYYSKVTTTLSAGSTYTATIGAGAPSTPSGYNYTGGNGGTTSVTLGGTTVASAGGGTGGSDGGNGGNGGSGGGGAATDGNSGGGNGGYWGSNGTGGNAAAGSGQLGLGYNSGNNSKIPPGGQGVYGVGPTNHRNYAGILGYGAGLGSGGLNATDHTARGAGGGGAGWNQPGRFGVAGFVVIDRVVP